MYFCKRHIVLTQLITATTCISTGKKLYFAIEPVTKITVCIYCLNGVISCICVHVYLVTVYCASCHVCATHFYHTSCMCAPCWCCIWVLFLPISHCFLPIFCDSNQHCALNKFLKLWNIYFGYSYSIMINTNVIVSQTCRGVLMPKIDKATWLFLEFDNLHDIKW